MIDLLIWAAGFMPGIVLGILGWRYYQKWSIDRWLKSKRIDPKNYILKITTKRDPLKDFFDALPLEEETDAGWDPGDRN